MNLDAVSKGKIPLDFCLGAAKQANPPNTEIGASVEAI